MTESLIKIEPINHDQAIPFELLTLADPSISQCKQLKRYLHAGQCYVAKIDSQLVGVLVLKELSPTTIEIKNIAIVESMQRKGYGKQLLKFAEGIARKSNYQKLIIGTGNSSIGQLALYQKEGFEITRVVKDFFITNYKEPIFENGIQCKHMIMLEKELH